jgi:hypothetical protein
VILDAHCECVNLFDYVLVFKLLPCLSGY